MERFEGECGPKLKVLIGFLGSSSSDVRYLAAKRLGAMKDKAKEAVGVLQGMAANDASAGNRAVARDAIASITGEPFKEE